MNWQSMKCGFCGALTDEMYQVSGSYELMSVCSKCMKKVVKNHKLKVLR